MDVWSHKEAEARFGEMLERCLADGPQVVTRDGADAAVLVPIRDWVRPSPAVRADKPPVKNLKDWLMTDFARGDIPIPVRGSLDFRVPDLDE